MRRLIAMSVIAVGLQLASCTPSIHPLYTPEDVVFDPALVGQWSGNNFHITFTRHGEKAYRFVHTDKNGQEGVFVAHLLELDGHRFLDLFPEHKLDGKESNTFYEFHLLPTHTFMRVDQITPTLQMAPMNPKWVEEFVTQHPEAISHEITGKRIVLTAPTEDLQAFVVEHAETDDAFGKPTDLQRSEDTSEK